MLKWVVRVMVEYMALSLKIPLGQGGGQNNFQPKPL